MDITPIYELRERLRAAMIAGTNLLPEDFRLKRAVEAFAPLEQAAPVFAKIGQLSRSLLEPGQTDPAGLLLDAITLVDAVLCTQGAVAADGGNDLERLGGPGKADLVVNAPYSVLNALTEALTSSGSGHFAYVSETHQEHPELFRDYRVKAALVRALGASYGELAGLAEVWLKEDRDPSLLPLLKKGFDPEGKREMVRRVWVMEAVAPREATPFFTEQLENAKKEVRQALIYSLRNLPENEELLWDLEKTEKGNNKKAVYYALADMDSAGAERFFAEMCAAKPQEAMQYLLYSRTAWAARLVAAKLEEQLRPFEDDRDHHIDDGQADLLRATVQAALGKTGPEMERALRFAVIMAGRLDYPFENPKKPWELDTRYARRRIGTGRFRHYLAEIMHRTLIRTGDAGMGRFAAQIYEERARYKEDREAYFPVAAMGRLIADEDCGAWLSRQLLGLAQPKDLYPELAWAWGGVSWDAGRGTVVCRDTDMGPFDNRQTEYVHDILQDMTGKIADILMQCGDMELDKLLIGFSGPENKAYRAKLEDYYYKRALSVDDNRIYLWRLKEMGCTRCEGLMVRLLEKSPELVWDVGGYIEAYLPGDNEARYRETQAVCDLVRQGKIRLKKIAGRDNRERLFEYLEELKARVGQQSV